MPNIRLTHQEFYAYAQWTASLWGAKQGAHTIRGHAVTGLGLAGEAREVLEALQERIREGQATETLRKELGNAAYYCARLVSAFNLQMPAAGWTAQVGETGLTNAYFAVSPMFAAVGRVRAVLTKLLRDGVHFDDEDAFREILTQGLDAFIAAWLAIAAALGWQPQLVLKANRQRIEGLMAFGALQGRAKTS